MCWRVRFIKHVGSHVLAARVLHVAMALTTPAQRAAAPLECLLFPGTTPCLRYAASRTTRPPSGRTRSAATADERASTPNVTFHTDACEGKTRRHRGRKEPAGVQDNACRDLSICFLFFLTTKLDCLEHLTCLEC